MPFKSKAQQRFMFSNHPDIAKRWEDETPKDAKLPEHVQKKRKPLGFQDLMAKIRGEK